MYVTEQMIDSMAKQYGQPLRVRSRYSVEEDERLFIASAHREADRNHDFTVYVRHPDNNLHDPVNSRYLVIAKTVYPAGMYRAMSGGLLPGESFHDGIAREVAEEMGCTVKLQKFILRTDVVFQAPQLAARWRSFVFTADFVGGDFQFTDTHEIREVRWAQLSEFDTFGRLFRNGPKGAMQYRATLHELVLPLLAQS